MNKMPLYQINERAQRLLKLLVTRYIRDGQPVGSRTLARECEMSLSPATIRNVMSDLEEIGLVHSPHTSAGRIPTVLGYRLFIDSLLQIQPLNEQEENLLYKQLNQQQTNNSQTLLTYTSNLLSEVTHLASIVMLPRRNSNRLRHIEFLPLSSNRVLVIFVINDHEVQNRIIQTSRSYSPSDLQQVANYLNAAFVGKDIKTVRSNLLQEMQETRQTMDGMMQAAVEMAEKTFVNDNEDDFLMAGQTNLMGAAEFGDVEKLRDLFEVFNKKRDILQLLDQALNAQGVQIFIGEESGYKMLGECSIVTSPYMVGSEVIGVLGVIGPTRMAYDRIIPIVDLTARVLGTILNRH